MSVTTVHLTGHVPTKNIRPATIHQEQPSRLHLNAKRRPTFRVHPLRKGSVDHKRLRSDETLLPSQDIARFRKTTFFFSLVCGWCHKHKIGGARYRTRNHLFALDETSRVTQRHHSLTMQGNRLNRTPLFRIRTYTSAQTTEKATRSTSTPTYIS